MALQEEHYALREICTEQEKTLEELGAQLSTAKLAAVELREAADNAQQQPQQEGVTPWANDRLVSHCKGCTREFNIARRKVIKLFNYLPSSGLSCLLTNRSSVIILLQSSDFRLFNRVGVKQS